MPHNNGSYQQGFADNEGDALHPEFWQGIKYAWCPGLGPTGLKVWDWGGKRNHANFNNITAAEGWVFDETGYAVKIGTTNDHLQLDSYISFPDDANWSYSCWVKIANMGNFRMFFADNVAAGTRFFIGTTTTYYYDAAQNNTTWPVTLSTNVWHHVALTQRSEDTITSKNTLYFDGVSQGENTRVIGDSAMQVNSFGIGNGDSHELQGNLTDMIFWDRLLNAEQIQRLYQLKQGALFREAEDDNFKAPDVVAAKNYYVGGFANAQRNTRGLAGVL